MTMRYSFSLNPEERRQKRSVSTQKHRDLKELKDDVNKTIEIRKELLISERRNAHQRKEKIRICQELRPLALPRHVVTIDTSKSRSNMDVLRMCARKLGWKEFPLGRKDQSCDIYWNAVHFEENLDISSGKVSKFPGMHEICSKITLFRCLDRMRELFPDEYNFYPKSWYLPTQFHEFAYEIKQHRNQRTRPKPTYIVKPDDGTQGEGIYLIRDPQEYIVQSNRCHVIQEYLSNVYLIDKFKFDLRVYVVITNLEPLQIHICKEGLVRFSTIPYENPTHRNIHETYMHLTNYSLNKRSSMFNRSDKEDEGSKRKLSSVLRKLSQQGHDTQALWNNLERLICKTILAIVPEMKVEYQSALPAGKPGPSCFQILGFDILLMKNLKPMLLEVNSSPSLRIDCEQETSPGVMEYVQSLKDEEVKCPLVRDTLLYVAPPHKMKYRRKKRKPKKKQELKSENLHLRPRRGTIIIINADESDEEKRVRDITQRMSDIERFNRNSSPECKDEDQTEKEEKSDCEDDAKTRTSEDSDSDYEIVDKTPKETCLKLIYPDLYEDDYEELRMLEKLAAIFIQTLGIRGAQRIGPTAFRTFSRKCRLNRHGMTNAAIDILFIDMQRKWEHLNPERTTGLCFQGFLDACYEIARRTFFSQDKFEMMDSFINYCKSNLQVSTTTGEHSQLPKLRDRRLYQRSPYFYMPKNSFLHLTSETIYNLPIGGRNCKLPSSSEIQPRRLSLGKLHTRHGRKSGMSYGEE
ncbi:hypothetical protein ScPMuIL_010359 [Solemya velum]